MLNVTVSIQNVFFIVTQKATVKSVISYKTDTFTQWSQHICYLVILFPVTSPPLQHVVSGQVLYYFYLLLKVLHFGSLWQNLLAKGQLHLPAFKVVYSFSSLKIHDIWGKRRWPGLSELMLISQFENQQVFCALIAALMRQDEQGDCKKFQRSLLGKVWGFRDVLHLGRAS